MATIYQQLKLCREGATITQTTIPKLELQAGEYTIATRQHFIGLLNSGIIIVELQPLNDESQPPVLVLVHEKEQDKPYLCREFTAKNELSEPIYDYLCHRITSISLNNQIRWKKLNEAIAILDWLNKQPFDSVSDALVEQRLELFHQLALRTLDDEVIQNTGDLNEGHFKFEENGQVTEIHYRIPNGTEALHQAIFECMGILQPKWKDTVCWQAPLSFTR